MATNKLIAIREFCKHHDISTEFIFELYQHDMVELVKVKRTDYIPSGCLHKLEKIIRLHHDLDIIVPGIQTVLHLLSTIEKQENEIKKLRNKLEFHVS